MDRKSTQYLLNYRRALMSLLLLFSAYSVAQQPVTVLPDDENIREIEKLPATSAGAALQNSTKTPFLCEYAKQVYEERQIDMQNLEQRKHSSSERQRMQTSLESWAERVDEFCR